MWTRSISVLSFSVLSYRVHRPLILTHCSLFFQAFDVFLEDLETGFAKFEEDLVDFTSGESWVREGYSSRRETDRHRQTPADTDSKKKKKRQTDRQTGRGWRGSEQVEKWKTDRKTETDRQTDRQIVR